jgi:hypothetical protein
MHVGDDETSRERDQGEDEKRGDADQTKHETRDMKRDGNSGALVNRSRLTRPDARFRIYENPPNEVSAPNGAGMRSTPAMPPKENASNAFSGESKLLLKAE